MKMIDTQPFYSKNLISMDTINFKKTRITLDLINFKIFKLNEYKKKLNFFYNYDQCSMRSPQDLQFSSNYYRSWRI